MNSLLVEYDNCIDENFILPKYMHLCMIRFIDNTIVTEGEHQVMKTCEMEDGENMNTHAINILISVET